MHIVRLLIDILANADASPVTHYNSLGLLWEYSKEGKRRGEEEGEEEEEEEGEEGEERREEREERRQEGVLITLPR